MNEITITIQPLDTIEIRIDSVELIHLSENDSNMPDFFAIYQQAKEINHD